MPPHRAFCGEGLYEQASCFEQVMNLPTMIGWLVTYQTFLQARTPGSQVTKIEEEEEEEVEEDGKGGG